MVFSNGHGLDHRSSRGEVNSFHKPRSGYYCYVTVSLIQLQTTYPIVAMSVEWYTDTMPRYVSLLCDICNAPQRNDHNLSNLYHGFTLVYCVTIY